MQGVKNWFSVILVMAEVASDDYVMKYNHNVGYISHTGIIVFVGERATGRPCFKLVRCAVS